MPDTSARIAILGAGPIGLEAALYARYLGFPVVVLERSKSIAANILKWGHVQLFTPFRMNATPLGVAAIQTQSERWERPAAEELLTGTVYHQRYLEPLSETDLLANAVQFDSQVCAIGRKGWLKSEGVGNPQRAQASFSILCQDSVGKERIHEADVVIDCTGTYGNHNWLGQGGAPALGERVAAAHIEYGLPDLGGCEKDAYLGRRTLVVGAGYSAATSVLQLSRLASDQPNSSPSVVWLTRRPAGEPPITQIANDRLASRDQLARAANQIAFEQNGFLSYYADTCVTSIEYRQDRDDFLVRLAGIAEPQIFDHIIANVGYRPDNSIFEELQVHQCYGSGGTMRLAAQLQAQNDSVSVDCLDQTSCGPQSLLTTEPNYYILGNKSYGRGNQFLLSIGFEQIRDLFTTIAEREDLDLYATMPQLKS